MKKKFIIDLYYYNYNNFMIRKISCEKNTLLNYIASDKLKKMYIKISHVKTDYIFKKISKINIECIFNHQKFPH